MKDAITSRLQLFLAKIAGRDVSESTLTPPVIANMEEKLLDEIANRMDAVEEAASSGGGGGVITIDLASLAENQKIVDFMISGDKQESITVFLYDIDSNSQYHLLVQNSPSEMDFLSIMGMSVGTASECTDIESGEFKLAETISGETVIYVMADYREDLYYFLPTTTQFKTYKTAADK